MRKIVLLLLLLSGVAACSLVSPTPQSAAKSAAPAPLPATKSAADTADVPKKSPDRPRTKIVQRYDGPAEIE